MSTSVKYRYRNISDQPQALIGFGLVQPGAIIEVDQPVNNPNFELVFGGDDKVGVEAPPKKPKHK